MSEKQVKWLSSRTCDFCGTECQDFLVDGKTNAGPWATMCKICATKYSLAVRLERFGTGIGQLYKKNENDEFIKIKG